MTTTTPILHIAMVEPDIAPNVGTVARMCAATGIRVHLIGKLGFRLNDKALRRAGLDYWQHVDLHQHLSWEEFRTAYPQLRCFALSARASMIYTSISFAAGDCLVLGSETQGLP
ncbi:MAG TPA: TrmH family RNA methyltransferase, partial [Gemmatales bacterium]|nr:TrmH family RNA methyltransferase [Gemmatales bacterium]